MSLERATKEGNSPVSESIIVLLVIILEYHMIKIVLWELGSTACQD